MEKQEVYSNIPSYQTHATNVELVFSVFILFCNPCGVDDAAVSVRNKQGRAGEGKGCSSSEDDIGLGSTISMCVCREGTGSMNPWNGLLHFSLNLHFILRPQRLSACSCFRWALRE